MQNPNFGRRFLLQTDASDHGVGAVLSQNGDTRVYYTNRSQSFGLAEQTKGEERKTNSLEPSSVRLQV